MAGKLTAGEEADRLSRRRSRVLWVSALFFIVWQGAFATWGLGDRAPVRAVDQVKLSAWVVWALVLLVILATGGGLLRSPAVKARLNDEVAVAHRHEGQRFGFWIAVLSLIGAYVAAFFVTLSVHDLLHIVLTLSIGGALLRYAVLERRAERGA